MQMSFFMIFQNYLSICKQAISALLKKFDAERLANFCSPRFSPWRKILQIPKSGITHMVTSNGGHPLHHHLRHSSRLSNSLFNRRTTKQTFTHGCKPQHCSSPPSGLLGHLFPPQRTEYSHI